MSVPPTLGPAALDRLGKLLGMLGSAHDGERAAAAEKANSFLRNNGLTWGQLIELLRLVQSDGAFAARSGSFLAHRQDALEALASPIIWLEREFDFLTNMTRRRKALTDGQERWLSDLLDRARASRAAA